MQSSPLSLCEDVISARSEAELHQAIQRATTRLGFDYYCFAMVYQTEAQPDANDDELQHYTFDNFGQGWIEHFKAENYAEVDVAVTHCFGNVTPLVWTRDLYATPVLRQVQEDALAYGIDGGISVPIHSPWLKGGGMLTLSSAEHADACAAHANDYVAESLLLACHVSQAVRDLGLLPQRYATSVAEALSARETECLLWAAAGLSAKRIADRMRISTATVSTHYLPAIRRKLKVSSTREAIALAIRHGLIRP